MRLELSTYAAERVVARSVRSVDPAASKRDRAVMQPPMRWVVMTIVGKLIGGRRVESMGYEIPFPTMTAEEALCYDLKMAVVRSTMIDGVGGVVVICPISRKAYFHPGGSARTTLSTNSTMIGRNRVDRRGSTAA